VSSAPIEYILKNSAVWMFQYDVGGTPRGIPRHAWKVSLWTFGWELLCYTGVAVVGVVGLLSRRWFLSVAMALVRQFAYAAAWQHSRGRLDTFTAATLKTKARIRGGGGLPALSWSPRLRAELGSCPPIP
jgi:hypothetical protein